MKLITSSSNLLSSLEKINIFDSEDLFNHLPYRYEDMSYSEENDLIDKEKITILGRLVSNPKHFKNGKYDIITFYFISKKGNFYNVKIFNRGYLMKQLRLGEDFTIVGVYEVKNKQIIASSIVKGVIESDKQIRAVYHLPSEISSNVYRKFLKRHFEKYQEFISDNMPICFKNKYRLLNRVDALKKVHFPKNESDVSLGLRTLKYYECLSYSLKNQIIRGENKRIPSIEKEEINTKKINELIMSLPFKLTEDQINAVREIVLDMNKKELMYRLLQGDVGTGKTIVAAIALYGNFLRHKVGAFMVPTDSLARQQYDYMVKLFSSFGVNVGLLIGAMSLKEKNKVKDDLKSGKINIIVGTHALFSSDVEYSSLGLAIIDEQHRFGVNQRNELISKDDSCDLLLMSATPIPRTLSLSIYGDLDITSLANFPNKERNVRTKVVDFNSMEIFSCINDCLFQNRQVFIVAPKIKGNEKSVSAEKLYEMYSVLYKDNVRLLHGKMKSEEKTSILNDFIEKKFLILVSTTVIELGINVLDAGAIIIYSSGSFGLASLHQLRGRVGRNGNEATCLLVDEDVDNQRLRFLEGSSDGFEIAELDMKLRGPGDTLGFAQSGFPTFSCLNIVNDFKMFECAREDARQILDNLDDKENMKYYEDVLYKIKNQEDIVLFD